MNASAPTIRALDLKLREARGNEAELVTALADLAKAYADACKAVSARPRSALAKARRILRKHGAL